MGMKVKVASILKAPILCNQLPKTHSFRAKDDQFMFKTLNSVYFDPTAPESCAGIETPESWFTNTVSDSASASFSAATEESADDNGGSVELLEAIIRGVQSERDSRRLLFEPGGESSSFVQHSDKKMEVEVGKIMSSPMFEETSVVMAMESEDPYLDFRRSMEEMVETIGLMKDDWEGLEELLGWYLSVNGKHNHGYIVSAFVDLLVGINNKNDKIITDNHQHDRLNCCCCCNHDNGGEESSCSTSSCSCFCCDDSNGTGSNHVDNNYEGDGLGVDGGRRSSASHSSAASFYSCYEPAASFFNSNPSQY